MITSPTKAGSMFFARANTSLITKAPKSGAATLAKEPPNLPTPVLAAETITMSFMNDYSKKTQLIKTKYPLKRNECLLRSF
jgi:hypothetical protein